MGKKQFDYYLFIDYSENYIGYLVLDKCNLGDCVNVSSRFRHYKNARNKKLYLKNAKKTFNKKEILDLFLKKKVREVIQTPEIFADVAEILKKYKDFRIFVSVDDRQYKNFEKFVKIVDGENALIVKEGKLKKGSREYKVNLILDTWLNIERTKSK
jgi:hypothetical protein